MKKLLLIVMLTLTALPAAAQDVPDLDRLTGDYLYDAFIGQTMDGIYKLPRQRSGTNEFTESFYADGTTFYREGELTDDGRWRIESDIICFSYSGDMSGGESCFVVYASGSCIYSYNPRNIRNGRPINSNAWSAKTLIRGDVSTCDNLVS
ncbi:hypothetical protein N9W89_02230 [Hellea sp.]|nr:hypothetical protein [Hellea sp.]